MISLLTFIIVSQAPKQTLLQQVIPNPTGGNGYEEYLAAADIVNSPAFREFKHWNKGLSGGKAPAGLTATSTQLARRQFEVRSFSGALKLIDDGNAKPTERGSRAMMVEFSQLLNLAQLGEDAAYVAYAKGDWKVGTTRLLSTLTFADNVSREYLTGHLIGCSMTAEVLAGLDAQKSRWTVDDCDRISKLCTDILTRRPSVSDAIAREAAFAKSSIDKMDFDAGPADPGDPESVALTQRLKGLDSSQREQLKAMLQERMAKRFERFAKRVQLPEAKWSPAEGRPTAKAPSSLPTLSDVCDAVLLNSSSFEYALPVSLERRVQIRLLRVNADIQKFRWQHGRLPAQLVEATTPEVRQDPLTEDAFRYEHVSGGYRLSSPGLAKTGVIELTDSKVK